MILTKDSVVGNTIHEIRDQLEQLLQYVDRAAQDAVKWCGFFDRKNPLNKVDFFWVKQGAFALTP